MKTLREYLPEARVLTQVRLTDNQKQALAVLLSNPEGRVHDDEISSNRNKAGARDVLLKLGLLARGEDDWIEITDKGRQVAEDENLVVDAQLSPEGEKFASKTDIASPSGQPSIAPDSDANSAPLPFGNTSTEIAAAQEQFNMAGKLIKG